jgi:tetratricopeptide (TPR) repeat protein
MGEADSLAGARLFSQGMAFYRNGNDSAAVHSLRQALRLDSTNAAALFYLGVSCMQLGQLDAATAAFAKGLALNDSLYHERLLWYDGNARLARNDDARALQRFEALKALSGKYAARAEEKLGAIEQAQKNYSTRHFFQKIRNWFKSSERF